MPRPVAARAIAYPPLMAVLWRLRLAPDRVRFRVVRRLDPDLPIDHAIQSSLSFPMRRSLVLLPFALLVLLSGIAGAQTKSPKKKTKRRYVIRAGTPVPVPDALISPDAVDFDGTGSFTNSVQREVKSDYTRHTVSD